MCGDAVTGLEIGDGTDDLTVFGEKTVTSAVDAFGVEGSESLFEQLDAMPAKEDLPFCGSLQTEFECLDAFGLFVEAMNKPFSDRGRSLEGFACHHIEHGDIACMSDTGEDREFELGTDGAEGIGVKTREIGGCSAATDDDDCVK